MAQADYSVANQSASDVRAEMNEIFSAIATNNSGAIAPTTTFAYQWWYDTSTNILKIRNAANDAHIAIATFDQTNDKWSLGQDIQDADFRNITANSFNGANSVAVHGGWASNIALKYSGGALSISGNSAALSATNPGYITMQSRTTPGLLKTITVIEDQSFTDASGISDINDNLFGFTSSVDITTDVPFFPYAVLNNNEDDVAFMLSRYPHCNLSPNSANIGAPDDPVADAEGDFFSFKNIDETLYDNNPCVRLGCLRMRMASDDWTVQALTNRDGFGKDYNDIYFQTPLGQFGANAGTWELNNGGTAPQFSIHSFNDYRVTTDGLCYIIFSVSGDGGGDGAGAVTSKVTKPYTSEYTATVIGSIQQTTWHKPARVLIAADDNTVQFAGDNGDLAVTVFWNFFANGNRSIAYSGVYTLQEV